MNKDMDDEGISAFAFNMARQIEDTISERTNDLEKELRMQQAMILNWYVRTNDEEFAKHFGIVSDKYHDRRTNI